MKNLKISILISVLMCMVICLQSCNDDDPSDKEVTESLLQSKSWKASSVVVPDNTATDSDDWLSFIVSFNATMMNTSGHPAGAEGVWPSGSYAVSDDGKSITRQDGAVVTITNISETNFTATFAVPKGTEINGRVAALDGEYIFNME